jgi:hypothetical protein
MAAGQRARSVFTVTLEFNFLLIIGVRTVVAAVGFESGNLARTLFIPAFMLTAYVDNFCHNAPRFLNSNYQITQGTVAGSRT